MLFYILIFIILVVIVLKIYCVLTLGKCNSTSKLTGKVALVTGSNRGIGYYTALNLAKRGAKVIITSENFEDLKRAQNELIKESGNSDIVAKHLDYLALDNVRSFVKDILDTEPKLDILVNNAGSVGLGQKLTKDGLLPVMQVNHFAPFLLTNLLLGLLKKSSPSRIVNVASAGANYGFAFKADNINSLKGLGNNSITEIIEYLHSKICTVSWTIEMAKRLKGQGVTVNCLHPGMVYTKIYKQRKLIEYLADFGRFLVMKTHMIAALSTLSSSAVIAIVLPPSAEKVLNKMTPQEGAQTTIHLAACEKVEGVTGKYFSDCRPSWIWANFSAKVRDLIWEQSVTLSGLKAHEIKI